jgi:hypothetical protein
MTEVADLLVVEGVVDLVEETVEDIKFPAHSILLRHIITPFRKKRGWPPLMLEALTGLIEAGKENNK